MRGCTCDSDGVCWECSRPRPKGLYMSTVHVEHPEKVQQVLRRMRGMKGSDPLSMRRAVEVEYATLHGNKKLVQNPGPQK